MSTGLNFQTQTIINSNKDINSAVKNGNGADGTWLFKAVGDDQKTAGSSIFRVKRDFLFEKDNILSVYKAEAYEPILTKAEIDFTNIDLEPADGEKYTYGRIDIYLGLEGSEEYLYANPWIQKGIPLWVEFTFKKGQDKEAFVKKLAADIKKDKNFLIDHELIIVEANGAKLTLTGADEYQRIRKIEVVTFNETDTDTETVASMEDDNEIKLVDFGENGFGTYSHIVRDLRLLTMDNVQPYHLRKAETPILDALYNQYIINYCAPASNDGTQAVGQRLSSTTQHVFWVNTDVAADFEAELVKVHAIDNTLAAKKASSTTDSSIIGD